MNAPIYDSSTPPSERALVLGGGGSAGNAWLIGVIAGLADGGLTVTDADLTIGTSAGSTAAAQLAGASASDLLAAILRPTHPPTVRQPPAPQGSNRPGGGGPVANHLERLSQIIADASDPADMRRRLGAAALTAAAAGVAAPATPSDTAGGHRDTANGSVNAAGKPYDAKTNPRDAKTTSDEAVRSFEAERPSEEPARPNDTATPADAAARSHDAFAPSDHSAARWRATVAARLPGPDWPAKTLRITAIDAETGEPAVFDRHSGVDLVDAVAASCANGFGVPPYPIGGRHYLDGGYRRNENADLAAGCRRVLVLSPLGGRTLHPLGWGMQLAAQVDELRAGGSVVETILPDAASRQAFGDNMMDLSARPPAARAGYEQGRALAGELAEFWR